MDSEEREVTDGVTLEEIDVLVDGFKLFTCTDAKVTAKQDKKILHGAGARKGFGRSRSHKTWEGSFECTGVNMALLTAPNDFQGGQGDVSTFTLGGVTYKSILDLRNVSLVFLYPYENGTRNRRVLTGVEFTEHGFSGTLEDAEGQSLTFDAIDGEGWV